MLVFTNEASSVLESMKSYLLLIENKLETTEILEDFDLFKKYQDKAKWVRTEINTWEEFIQDN